MFLVGLAFLAILSVIASTACTASTPAAAPHDVELGGTASPSIAFDFGSVWAGRSDAGEVIRLDPATGSVVTRIKAGDPAKQSSRARQYHGAPVGIASGFGAIWATGADEILYRIDPRSGAVSPFPIEVTGSAIAIGDDAVWVASYDEGALLRFDPAANKVANLARGQGSLQGLATGFGSVWAVNRSGHELVRFDPRSMAPTAHIPVARNPQSVIVAGGAVWVNREEPRALVRVDPATNTVTATFPADEAWGVGAGLAFVDGVLWLGNVARVDPATGKTLGSSIASGADEGLALAVGGGSAWVVEGTKIRQVPVALVK